MDYAPHPFLSVEWRPATIANLRLPNAVKQKRAPCLKERETLGNIALPIKAKANAVAIRLLEHKQCVQSAVLGKSQYWDDCAKKSASRNRQR
jgi:hypothetical protein